MADNNPNRYPLTRLLRKVPDRTPPNGLVDRIMDTVSESKQYGCSKRHKIFSFALWNNIRPRQLATASCFIALAFWLGLYVGGKKEDAITQPDILQLPGYVYQNAQAGFLVGRGLLAAGRGEEALEMIQHASRLSPANPEYLFWLGTAHWSMGDREMEQLSYRKAVQIDPDYLPVLVNLGHSLLENREPEEALQAYNRVLTIAPNHQIALYNRALAIHLIGNPGQAIAAWKKYLGSYRSGKWAYRAVQHLNEQGDFSYRTYQVGFRRVILSQDILLGPLTADKKREVDYLAKSFQQAPVSDINLVLFHEGDDANARMQAITLKSLLNNSLQDQNKHIQISWFGEAETVQTASGTHALKNGLLIFSQLRLSPAKEESI